MEFVTQKDIQKMPNGIIGCPISRVDEFMPEISHIINTFPYDGEWNVDAKVHMLMPGMFPCIPNWHYDFVPRDENKNQNFSKIDTNQKIYLWLSNAPITEFRDGRILKIQEWNEITQKDEHRGVASKEHIWRLFIRVYPATLKKAKPDERIKRRQIQTYLDAEKFTW